MKLTPKRAEPLSDRETATLRGVANSTAVGSDTPITKPLYKRLQQLGLIELRDGAFVLTQQGHIHLMFQGAR